MERREGWGLRVGVVHLAAQGGSEVMENQRGSVFPPLWCYPRLLRVLSLPVCSTERCRQTALSVTLSGSRREGDSGLYMYTYLSSITYAYIFRLSCRCISCLYRHADMQACINPNTDKHINTHTHMHARVYTTNLQEQGDQSCHGLMGL